MCKWSLSYLTVTLSWFNSYENHWYDFSNYLFACKNFCTTNTKWIVSTMIARLLACMCDIVTTQFKVICFENYALYQSNWWGLKSLWNKSVCAYKIVASAAEKLSSLHWESYDLLWNVSICRFRLSDCVAAWLQRSHW